MTRSFFALALGAALAAGPLQAQDGKLHYKDLDLATPEGKAELDRRIGDLAKQICSQQKATGTRLGNSSGSREMARCEAGVRAEVKARLASKS